MGGLVWQADVELKRYAADHYWWEIRRSRLHNEYFAAIRFHEFIKQNLPRHSYYDEKYFILSADWLKEFDDPRFRVFGEDRLKAGLPLMPERTFVEKRSKAKVLLALSDHEPDYLARAEALYRELIAYSPDYPLTNREYSDLLFKGGQFERALAQYHQTLSRLPSLDSKGLNRLHEARLKEEMAANYRGLVEVYAEIGDNDKAEKYRDLLIKLDNS